MLQKIVHIRNVGALSNCSCLGDATLGKFCVLYSENGHGKTTLCAILRSLQGSDSRIIEERRTIGSSSRPSVELRIDGSTLIYRDGAWSGQMPQIEVFDSHFVDQNVYTGSYVDRDHKRRLYDFAMGEKGVTLARRIEALDDQSREISAELEHAASAISGIMPNPMDVVEFVGLKEDVDAERQLALRQFEVQVGSDVLEEIARPLFAELVLPAVPEEAIASALSSGLEDVAATAEAKLQFARQSPGVESWTQQGMEYMKDEECPFCHQKVTGNRWIEAYRVVFGSEYRAAKEAVASLRKEVTELLGDKVLVAFQRTVSQNEVSLEYWSKFLEVKLIPPEIAHVEEALSGVRNELLRHLEGKSRAPLEAVVIEPSCFDAIGAYRLLRVAVDAYNALVRQANSGIEERKKRLKAQDIEDIRGSIRRLENVVARQTEKAREYCDRYMRLSSEKKGIGVEKKAAKADLDECTAGVFAKYEKAINIFLERFGTSFRIAGTGRSFVGGKPSCAYYIDLYGQKVDPTETQSSEPLPSFRTLLSEGDKNSLALAFFLARIEGDADIGSKVIVFDDPVSSLDTSRRACTIHEICSLSAAAAQVVVLSHDPFFLADAFANGASAESRRAVRLSGGSSGQKLTEWDVVKETQTQYFKDYAELLGFINASEVSSDDRLVSISRSIRPILEGYLRTRFPEYFESNEWLGNYIDKVRSGSIPDLDCLSASVSELDAINEYSKRFHHAGGPTVTVNEVELRAYAKRTIAYIHTV